jgi:formamidopyrimidine-DNA glycosylase
VPELPFLEILAENLAAAVSGRRIEAIEIRQPALLRLATPSAASFHGEYLSHPSRVGKYLVFETESRRAIVFHLMRLGRLNVVVPKPAGERGARRRTSEGGRSGGVLPKNVSARIVFDDMSELRLIEHGTEKRARLWLVDDLDAVDELRGIGPDPTRGGLTRETFAAAARATSRQLKSFLTDQRAIAGIGNGLADEILYEARLSPLKLTGKLTEEEAGSLHESVRSVLERQIALLRESAGGALPQKEPVEHYVVHDHKGEPCPRCGTPIAWISYAERDTFYCPGCQTGGTALKDRRLSRLLK